jgi:hypothetical protein
MAKRKLYDLIKELLTDCPELRDSDKKLIWRVWYETGYASLGIIEVGHFMHASSTESIRRCRQKTQELNPELRGTKWVQRARNTKAQEKGTFIFREKLEPKQGSLI